ncbi:hypothetical protein [Aminiphilus circumscriptus]|jgi:hypothetical protein|uniref:hypothetical protein n=1 Tax=Aminiphilus circumscriptus TaxID=290732 RepID=UPI0004785763|nr:hypothetical protein [Aminiphilus circumscriptus]
MRKMSVVVAVVAVLAVGGAAFAWGGMGMRSGWMGCMDGCPMLGMSGGFGPMMMGAGDAEGVCGQKALRGRAPRMAQLPEDVRAKMTEVQKLYMQMRLVLLEEKPDFDKARELHEKMLTLHGELARWRFDQMVKFRTVSGDVKN